MHTQTYWTTPEAYMRGLAAPPRRRIAARLKRLVLLIQAAVDRHNDEMAVRRLIAASADLPAYLRRDIGLPPG